MIGGDRVEHDNVPRPLTSKEFDAIMREMDEVQEWMIDQLKRRRIAQMSLPLTWEDYD